MQPKTFHERVFDPELICEDDMQYVLNYEGAAVNSHEASEAPRLIQSVTLAPGNAGTRTLLTVRVAGVDAKCAALQGHGVTLLNQPIH